MCFCLALEKQEKQIVSNDGMQEIFGQGEIWLGGKLDFLWNPFCLRCGEPSRVNGGLFQ